MNECFSLLMFTTNSYSKSHVYICSFLVKISSFVQRINMLEKFEKLLVSTPLHVPKQGLIDLEQPVVFGLLSVCYLAVQNFRCVRRKPYFHTITPKFIFIYTSKGHFPRNMIKRSSTVTFLLTG